MRFKGAEMEIRIHVLGIHDIEVFVIMCVRAIDAHHHDINVHDRLQVIVLRLQDIRMERRLHVMGLDKIENVISTIVVFVFVFFIFEKQLTIDVTLNCIEGAEWVALIVVGVSLPTVGLLALLLDADATGILGTAESITDFVVNMFLTDIKPQVQVLVKLEEASLVSSNHGDDLVDDFTLDVSRRGTLVTRTMHLDEAAEPFVSAMSLRKLVATEDYVVAIRLNHQRAQ